MVPYERCNETIVLEGSLRLERGSVLRDCRVVSSLSSTRLSFHDLTMLGGVFHQRVPLHNHRFLNTSFRDVAFRGEFSGCDWGHHANLEVPESDGPPRIPTSIRGCDFSAARTNLCRLFDTDLLRTKLPRWPFFTVPDPGKNLQALHGQWGHHELDLVFGDRAETSIDRDAVAVLHDARDISARTKLPLAAVRRLIERIPCIQIIEGDEHGLLLEPEPAISLEESLELAFALGRAHELGLAKFRFWNSLVGGSLQQARIQRNGDCELSFDVSLWKARVPDAPEQISVRLKEARIRLLFSGVETTIPEQMSTRWQLAGVGVEGDEVILKPHRKDRGQIRIQYSEAALTDHIGQVIQLADWSNYRRRFHFG